MRLIGFGDDALRVEILAYSDTGVWAEWHAILFFNLLKTLAKDGSLVRVGKVYLRYYFKKSVKLRPRLTVSVMFLNRRVTHWHFYKFTHDTLAGQNAEVMTSGMNG